MAKWNRLSLLRECEALIVRNDFHLTLKTIDPKYSTAHVEFGWDNEDGAHDIKVTIDASQGGLIESLLHECLHIVLADEISANFNSRLEEVTIRAIEVEIWTKAMKSPDVKRWRTLINSKLET